MSSHDRRTPLERLIDEACKVTPFSAICLECPICHQSRRVMKHETDPKEIDLILYPCDSCRKGDEEPRYFDMFGEELTPDWR